MTKARYRKVRAFFLSFSQFVKKYSYKSTTYKVLEASALGGKRKFRIGDFGL
jgi:hypothetical protein